MLRVESWSGAASEDAEAPDGNLEASVCRLEPTVSSHLMSPLSRSYRAPGEDHLAARDITIEIVVA